MYLPIDVLNQYAAKLLLQEIMKMCDQLLHSWSFLFTEYKYIGSPHYAHFGT